MSELDGWEDAWHLEHQVVRGTSADDLHIVFDAVVTYQCSGIGCEACEVSIDAEEGIGFGLSFCSEGFQFEICPRSVGLFVCAQHARVCNVVKQRGGIFRLFFAAGERNSKRIGRRFDIEDANIAERGSGQNSLGGNKTLMIHSIDSDCGWGQIIA